jgi:hypothetical protein
MANKKFSQFTAGAAYNPTNDGLARIAGFTTGTTVNNIWTPSEIATGLNLTNALQNIYNTDGTIGTTRKALITDTIQFRNAGDTSDIFIMNTDGTFALGDGATSLTNTNVVIGKNAKDNNVSSAYSVVIGTNAQLYNAASQHSAIAIGESANARLYGVAIGRYSTHYGTTATTVGYSAFSGPKGVAIGYNSGVAAGTTSDVINIGYDAGSTGANSIVLNVSGSGASPATANAFGVYMTSDTTPDLEVVGSGTSTLRTNLNVTGNMEVDGQAWGDLYDPGTPIADGATFTPDWNNGNVQKIVIATGAAITVANSSNVNNGATYLLIIEQAGTGGTVTWGGKYKFPAATAPTLTSGAGKADVITMVAYNSASVLCSSTLDFLTT